MVALRRTSQVTVTFLRLPGLDCPGLTCDSDRRSVTVAPGAHALPPQHRLTRRVSPMASFHWNPGPRRAAGAVAAGPEGPDLPMCRRDRSLHSGHPGVCLIPLRSRSGASAPRGQVEEASQSRESNRLFSAAFAQCAEPSPRREGCHRRTHARAPDRSGRSCRWPGSPWTRPLRHPRGAWLLRRAPPLARLVSVPPRHGAGGPRCPAVGDLQVQAVDDGLSPERTKLLGLAVPVSPVRVFAVARVSAIDGAVVEGDGGAWAGAQKRWAAARCALRSISRNGRAPALVGLELRPQN